MPGGKEPNIRPKTRSLQVQLQLGKVEEALQAAVRAVSYCPEYAKVWHAALSEHCSRVRRVGSL